MFSLLPAPHSNGETVKRPWKRQGLDQLKQLCHLGERSWWKMGESMSTMCLSILPISPLSLSLSLVMYALYYIYIELYKYRNVHEYIYIHTDMQMGQLEEDT